MKRALLGVFCGLLAMAQQPELEITSPAGGSIFNPGQTITLTATSPANVSFTSVGVIGWDPFGISDLATSATSVPAQFSFTVPVQIACGNYAFSADGTTASGTIGYPSWSHDGQYLYFDTILTDDPAFFRIRISDRKLERLVSLKGLRRFWGNLGEWTGPAPDDSLLLVRDTSSQGDIRSRLSGTVSRYFWPAQNNRSRRNARLWTIHQVG